jgi:hypothetical protein
MFRNTHSDTADRVDAQRERFYRWMAIVMGLALGGSLLVQSYQFPFDFIADATALGAVLLTGGAMHRASTIRRDRLNNSD